MILTCHCQVIEVSMKKGKQAESRKIASSVICDNRLTCCLLKQWWHNKLTDVSNARNSITINHISRPPALLNSHL